MVFYALKNHKINISDNSVIQINEMYAAGDLLLSSEVYASVVAPAVRSEVCDHCLERRGLLTPPEQPPPDPLRRCSRCQVRQTRRKIFPGNVGLAIFKAVSGKFSRETLVLIKERPREIELSVPFLTEHSRMCVKMRTLDSVFFLCTLG